MVLAIDLAGYRILMWHRLHPQGAEMVLKAMNEGPSTRGNSVGGALRRPPDLKSAK